MKDCWISSNAIPSSNEMILCIFPFCSIHVVYYRDAETLNSDESLSIEAATPHSSEKTNHYLSDETIIDSPEVVAFKDTADSSQNPPY
jgi:hypothetical protein